MPVFDELGPVQLNQDGSGNPRVKKRLDLNPLQLKVKRGGGFGQVVAVEGASVNLNTITVASTP